MKFDNINDWILESEETFNITYENSSTDAYSDQVNMTAYILVNGEVVGGVDYVLFKDELTVSYIDVRSEWRRKGIASRLIKYIKKENPEYKYKQSMLTSFGSKFIQKDMPLHETGITESNNSNIVILMPGGFKPMTVGHISLIKSYAENPNVQQVKVIVGPGIRDGIDQDMAINIAQELTKNINKVVIEPSEHYSPVLTAYKYVDVAPPGTYALASSSKGKDYTRVKEFTDKHQKGGKYFESLPKGVNVIELPIDVSPKIFNGRTDENEDQPISASVLRNDIKNKDKNNFTKGYPGIDEDIIENIWTKLAGIVKEQFVNTLSSGSGNYSPVDKQKVVHNIIPLEEEEEDDEKLVKENISFKRGLAPKRAMALGKPLKIVSFEEEYSENGPILKPSDVPKDEDTWNETIDDDDFIHHILSNWKSEIHKYYGAWILDSEGEFEWIWIGDLEGKLISYKDIIYNIPIKLTK